MPEKLPSLSEFLNFGFEHAKTVLMVGRGKEISAIVHIVDRNFNHGIIPIWPWSTDIQRQIVFAEAKAMACKLGARRAMFVAEFWSYLSDIRPKTTEEAQRLYEQMKPSDHPRREEAVLVAATDGHVVEHRLWRIVRDRPGGRVVSLVLQPTDLGMVGDFSILDGIIPEPDPAEKPARH